MKIASVVGARPQFIKFALVSQALRQKSHIKETLIHTGQHYDSNVSDVFFDELDIPKPDYNLGIGSGRHGMQTGRMLESVEEVLLKEKPNWVLVYGDTNSTLAGALAAVKLHIRVAHVEAGLRSFNRYMPEEINRVVTDHVSDVLFAPTHMAVENLRKEGIPQHKIRLVGDVMYDAAVLYGAKAEHQSRILKQFRLVARNYVLATVHRAENTDDCERLRAIFQGLVQVSGEMPVILPVHPRTRNRLKKFKIETKGLKLIDPVGYLDMAMLEKNARLIATDSGGVQKEAFFYRVPCITLREETEWVELVQLGWNQVVPPHTGAIIAKIIVSNLDHKGKDDSPYGDGRAAQVIVESLLEIFR